MHILFLGDIVGKTGITAVESFLKEKRGQYDFIIANGENVTGGRGINKADSDYLFSIGINALTMGNHVWDNKEFAGIADDLRFIRPANYPAGTPGKGFRVYTVKGQKIGIINLMGSIFMEPLLPPFQTIDKLLSEAGREIPLIVDIHAEATSEKRALGYYLDGRVAAVIGTHTHIQTADEEILPGGTAYITDVGMCGSNDSILGIKKEIIINKFLTKMPSRFEVADQAPMVNGVEICVNNTKSTAIQRIRIMLDQK